MSRLLWEGVETRGEGAVSHEQERQKYCENAGFHDIANEKIKDCTRITAFNQRKIVHKKII